jgi:1-acyl-sn-glycerol-3-phosphate acyltransferase
MTPKAFLDYVVLAIGIVLLALECFAWALAALILNLLLPENAERRLGRLGAMWGFRIYLGAMEGLGAWRLDLSELDRLEGEGALIIAPNHPCLLDAVLIVSRLPNALCVMKGSLLANFLLGPAARLARYVRNDSLLRLASRATQELARGGQLVIFPEGTRTVGGPIGPLTEAVGAISRRSGVPVQVVLIETQSRFLGKGWQLGSRPDFPLAYRARLGRRFDPPEDVRAFTTELDRNFRRELAVTSAIPLTEPAGIEDAPDLRG